MENIFKKIFREDILKKYGSLYQLLIKRFDMKTDLSLFEPGLSANESFLIFKEALQDNDNGINHEYIRYIMHIYVNFCIEMLLQ